MIKRQVIRFVGPRIKGDPPPPPLRREGERALNQPPPPPRQRITFTKKKLCPRARPLRLGPLPRPFRFSFNFFQLLSSSLSPFSV